MIEQHYKDRIIRLSISRYSRDPEIYICIAEWDGRTASAMSSSEAGAKARVMAEVKRAIDEEEEGGDNR